MLSLHHKQNATNRSTDRTDLEEKPHTCQAGEIVDVAALVLSHNK